MKKYDDESVVDALIAQKTALGMWKAHPELPDREAVNAAVLHT